MTGFDSSRLDRLGTVIDGHVTADRVAGVAWLAARDDDVVVGVHGTLSRGEAAPVTRDSLFRISSMTKPIVAAAAMVLVEQCVLRLDDPIDDLLPELADRRVLADGRGSLAGESVPAERPITLLDVLEFRLGLGMDFDAPWPQPLMDAFADLALGGGPPAPQTAPEPDEWMRRLGTLPLLYQPGARWLYDTGGDVLGVLVARAAGRPLGEFLATTLFEPLGMVDTAFHTAPDARSVDRLGSCYGRDDATGAPVLYDAPDGQWSTAPAFESGSGGLLSTVDDLHAFASMLLADGRLPNGDRLLSPAAVRAMTTEQLGVDRGAPGPTGDGSQGWGLGMGVQVRPHGLGPGVGSYGWAGGLGSMWSNDPAARVIGIMLTTDMFGSSAAAPAVISDFWTSLYAAIVE